MHALPELATLLGLSCREVVALATSDSRVVAPAALETPVSVQRTRRWLDARRPVAEPERVAFNGSASVRSLVIRTLAGLPAPVAWHATKYVTWFEVGRDARAWQHTAPQMLAPAGDSAHVIVLCGLVADEELVGIIGHELGHSWHRAIHPMQVHVPMSDNERYARQLVVARDRGVDLETYARELVAEERIADRTALAWGLRRVTGDPGELGLLRHFRSHLEAAVGLSAEIERQIDADADITDRAAAAH